ncbi:hypothetical protein [Streptomyces sp. MST-110588]|uniref:hypothetical protein n=1 Tax=Streptomyces sp. MST-110588 TaxID=2833628 RepID=UPI001F5D11E0|nr:hypothetical protein [Streptomyces sp. MST-110588]UNO42431.1 hypothetical protein KGS77_26530 [Streptomyces sp. MST-110588]
MAFEIRILCDRHEADGIVAVLADAFLTGPARQYPARDGIRTRLYITAEKRPPIPPTEGMPCHSEKPH